MSKTTEAKARKEECINALKKYLSPGSTVYTVLRHVSASGMQRRIDLYTICDNRMIYLSGYAEGAGLAKRHKTKEGLIVNGCGMDMGYHLVYNLSYILFGYEAGDQLRHEWI